MTTLGTVPKCGREEEKKEEEEEEKEVVGVGRGDK